MIEKLHRIVVPLEGVGTDQEAIRLACILAKPDKAEIVLLYVIEVRRQLPIDAELSEELERGERILSSAQREVLKAGCKAQTDLLQAREAGAAIVNESVERDAQLIVMGVPYQERYGEYCVETRAQFVLEHANCRVILAREPLATPAVVST